MIKVSYRHFLEMEPTSMSQILMGIRLSLHRLRSDPPGLEGTFVPELAQSFVDACLDFGKVGRAGKSASQLLYKSSAFSHLSLPKELWDSL